MRRSPSGYPARAPSANAMCRHAARSGVARGRRRTIRTHMPPLARRRRRASARRGSFRHAPRSVPSSRHRCQRPPRGGGFGITRRGKRRHCRAARSRNSHTAAERHLRRILSDPTTVTASWTRAMRTAAAMSTCSDTTRSGYPTLSALPVCGFKIQPAWVSLTYSCLNLPLSSRTVTTRPFASSSAITR